MTGMDLSNRSKHAAAAALALSALVFTAACNTTPQAMSAAQPQAFAPAPVSYQPVSYQPAAPVATRRVVQQPVYSDIPDAQVVPVSNRTVRTNQVVYDERPVKKTRSVAKSAIIIGSSAGAGAGVGAAVGGKKGALIGAAIGGGGATLWDQITRRK